VGAGTPQQRVNEQDADGIDGELLFASERAIPRSEIATLSSPSSKRSTIISSRSTAPSTPTG
jgi:hypothetical protein